jgi:thiamine-phosphate pyrophosphorylase
MSKKLKLEGLYAISDDVLTPKDELLEKITLTLDGGAKIIQLRDKISLDSELVDISNDIQELCKKYNAIFVMNDRFELAIKQKFQGIHIGKSDYENFIQIRKDFDGILGVSCYGDLENAKYFEENGADYVAFGSFFNSPTKPDSSLVSPQILKQAKEILTIPICAIGGINSSNIDDILSVKTDMVAVISDIWQSEDITKISKFYTNKLTKNNK